ncbi:MAG: transposase [Candidatus Subteraquimicrobiales bacterium]|nr:transposase [Candidatus Subteraquimicrobiales bacterium]
MKTKLNKKTSLRQRRIFSESVKKQVVKDIEKGKCSVIEAGREFQVSDQSIYNWIQRYSLYLKKNKVLIVEDKSEVYRSKELEKRVLELEAALGRKQMEIDLLEKVIDLANETYKGDLKKNLSKNHFNGSCLTRGQNTDTK